MRSVAVAAALLVMAGVAAPPARAAVPPEDATPAVGLHCVERLALPSLPNVIDAKWSPDSAKVALTWFARLPSELTVSGYTEQEVIDMLDLRSGALRPFGVGDRVQWSGSGAYLAYWGPRADELRVARPDGSVLARLAPTIPEIRWAGDELLFVEKEEIRAWAGGEVRTVARFADDMVPRYPRDDLYWSADGSRFSITRYARTGEVERWTGFTLTAATQVLASDGAALIEWAPHPATLLLRYDDRLELRDLAGGSSQAIPLTRGVIHGWTSTAALIVGRISPTVPGGDRLDAFSVVWPGPAGVASLPNLLGPRSFSPDGRFLAGATRTSTQDSELALYRCGDVPADAPRGAAAGRDRAVAPLAPSRFVRPVAGDIGQFMQGWHAGVDLAAPFGSPVVAADEGVVTELGWIPNGGERVCLEHAGGLETCYFHNSAALVEVG